MTATRSSNWVLMKPFRAIHEVSPLILAGWRPVDAEQVCWIELAARQVGGASLAGTFDRRAAFRCDGVQPRRIVARGGRCLSRTAAGIGLKNQTVQHEQVEFHFCS